MNNEARVIDFGRIEGPVYMGRDRGERLRAQLRLDELDQRGAEVEVAIPERTYAIGSSFFLGLFGPSVVRAGGVDSFYSRYRFRSPAFLKEVIDGYVVRALQRRHFSA